MPKGFERMPNIGAASGDNITFHGRFRVYPGPGVIQSVHWDKLRGVRFAGPETHPKQTWCNVGGDADLFWGAS